MIKFVIIIQGMIKFVIIIKIFKNVFLWNELPRKELKCLEKNFAATSTHGFNWQEGPPHYFKYGLLGNRALACKLGFAIILCAAVRGQL